MTSSKDLQSLIEQERDLKYQLEVESKVSKVFNRKQHAKDLRRLDILQYTIELITDEENFYKAEGDYYSSVKSEQEIKSEREASYNKAWQLLRLIFVEGLNLEGTDRSFGYTIEVSSLYKFPKLIDESDYCKLHMYVYTTNGNDYNDETLDDFYLTREDINRLGQEFNIEEFKNYGKDSYNYTRILSDAPIKKHI